MSLHDLARDEILALGIRVQVVAPVCLNTGVDMSTRRRAGLIRSPGPGEKQLHCLLVAQGIHPEPQYPIRGYYVDFALIPQKIVIEVDGASKYKLGSLNRKELRRQARIESEGWRFVRVLNHKVEEVFEKLRELNSKPYVPIDLGKEEQKLNMLASEWYGPVYRPLCQIRKGPR